MKNDKILYFCYGSNLNMAQMAHRCPHSTPVGRAILWDYKLEFRGNSRGYGVAHIAPAKGHEVVGGLWWIDPRDLKSLDRYEGYPSLYTRGDVEVEFMSKTVTAMTYWMTPGHMLAGPADRYIQTIEEGYADFGLDVEIFYNYCRRHYEEMGREEDYFFDDEWLESI